MSCISGKDSPINICLEKHLSEGTQKKGQKEKMRGMEGESESKNEPEREDRERRKSRRNK